MSKTNSALKQNNSEIFSKILGIGTYRATNIVPNNDLVAEINSSDEWIQKRTGIKTRRRADKNISVLDMAEQAALIAIEKSQLNSEQIDTVIVASVTDPHLTPSVATALTQRLKTNAAAYDISAACAGYCYAIGQADALVRSSLAKNVLVVAAEKLSDFIDPKERTISFLLGDGAGAVVVGVSDFAGISKTIWGSDGSQWNAVGMTHSILEIPEKNLPTLRQDGQKVFRWAVWEMAKVAKLTLAEAGVSVEQISAFIPHQANLRIINELSKQLELPNTVIVSDDIIETGNTSAASIPLATAKLLENNKNLSGKLALQIGFGAGLVYGAQVVVLP